MLKRISLFIALNLIVVLTISLILNLFQVRPFLTSYGLDYKSLALFCLIWGMGGAWISLGLSRIMAKWMMGVRVIDPFTKDSQQKHLLEIVHELAEKAGLPAMPEVGIYSSAEVNAFATGPSKRRALVAVSSGLLNHMDEEQLKGVLAHEISHIANGDMVTMTLIQGVVNAFVMFLARALAYALSGLGKNRQSSSNSSYLSYGILVFIFQIVFMILGSLIVAAFSRFREFKADHGGARLAGKESMISALKQLRHCQRMQDPGHALASIETMKISSSRGSWIQLFATHPPLEERIDRLRN